MAPPESPPSPPRVLATLRAVHLDVRDDLRQGHEPFSKIMGTVKALADGDVLVLRAPFEPTPLYEVLGRRGFAHWTERHAEADWSVWFYRDSASTAAGASAPAASAPPADITLDVRGLEPPHPMVRVLERLDTLAPAQTLVVVHDRRPVFLYPQLEDRGFVHETAESAPGMVTIRIRRAPGRAADARP